MLQPDLRDLLRALSIGSLCVAAGAQQLPRFVEMPLKEHFAELPAGTALAAGDFDGDGIDDLVIGAPVRDRLFLGGGQGGYLESTGRMPDRSRSSVVAPEPTRLHAFDVDGDGDLDLVGVLASGSVGCWSGTSGMPMLYRNDGSGTFVDDTAGNLQFGDFFVEPNSFASGDVDGDGDLDLVVGMRGYDGKNGVVSPKQNQLFLNDGTGSFTEVTASRFPVLIELTRAVELVDLEADGDLDLVIGSVSGASVWVNDGSGNFTDDTAARLPAGGQGAVTACDVDGDGDPDLVFGSSSTGGGRLYRNDGLGRFSDVTSSGGLPAGEVGLETDGSGESILVSDLNGDGGDDLVFGRQLFFNDAAGGFVEGELPAGGQGVQILADSDGDGFDDLVFLNGRRYRNGGATSFAPTFVPSLPRGDHFTQSAAAGDLNGDGFADLVLGEGGFRILLQDGFGAFHEAVPASAPAASQTWSTSLGDVDLDGDVDLILSDGGLTRLYLNDGRARFTDVTATHLPGGTWFSFQLALGDVDGDGDLDLVAGHTGIPGTQDQNLLLLNDGSGRFTDVTASHLPQRFAAPSALTFLDAEGDGDLDLVFASSDRLRLFLNDTAGRFQEAPNGSMPVDAGWSRFVVPADVDGDGDLDLLSEMQGGGRLYLNSGQGSFVDATTAQMPRLPGTPGSVTVGDLDEDGDLDLVFGIPDSCASRLGDHVAVLNDGSGTFAPAGSGLLPPVQDPNVQLVMLFDADADGDLDLFTANPSRFCGGSGCDREEPGPQRLFVNRARQMRSPGLAQLGASYRLEIHALASTPAAQVFAVPFLSSGSRRIALPGVGILRLDPAALLPVPVVQISQPAGVVTTSVPVPVDAALLDAEVVGQALLLLSTNRAALSNAVRDRIQR